MPILTVDDPATEEIAYHVQAAEVDAMGDVAAGAARAARAVTSLSLAERIALCEDFCSTIEARSDAIAADVTGQMGKPIREARAEVRTMLERARYMISIAADVLATRPAAAREGFELLVEKAPVGVVLDIAAWNYPLLIPTNVVVPAILAGNAVVLKHSSRTPLCAGHFAAAFAAAGAPPASVTALVAGHAATAALIARPEIGYVAFTGSVEGGRQVSRAAAGRFIDVGLELGGKDPAFVRADADLDFAAEQIADGAFYNSGQSCCAVERVYVDRRVHDDFVARLAAAAAGRVPGDPTDDRTNLGAMAQQAGIETVARHVGDAVARGARLVAGGHRTQVGGRGRYFEATVLADATEEMAVMREETFGPVAPVAAVGSDEEAVARMNDSSFGLTASLWTADATRARELAGRIEAGTVFLNRCDYLDPALPWTGWKDSGVGLTLSRLGFDRMVRTRSYHFRLPR